MTPCCASVSRSLRSAYRMKRCHSRTHTRTHTTHPHRTPHTQCRRVDVCVHNCRARQHTQTPRRGSSIPTTDQQSSHKRATSHHAAPPRRQPTACSARTCSSAPRPCRSSNASRANSRTTCGSQETPTRPVRAAGLTRSSSRRGGPSLHTRRWAAYAFDAWQPA